MDKKHKDITYNYLQADTQKVLQTLGKDALREILKSMLRIRNFEIRAEAAYLQGKIGGFFHAYVGQEAIQTACVYALGLDHWFTTSYRCHALALLTGATSKECMAELFGKVTGNALGRGGSMHLYTERMLGGFGIVGGQVPVAVGAAFSLKYLEKKDLISVGFLGDGAVAQGSFHESLNLASLWNLPAMIVIENNQWGMGTGVNRAISVKPIAENLGKNYDMLAYTLNGVNFFDCYHGFQTIYEEMKKTNKPALVEVVTERFKGHSISDPGLYRSKEDLKKITQTKDPILFFKDHLIEAKLLDEETFKSLDKEMKDEVLEALDFADSSPFPDLLSLEEGVYNEEDPHG